MLDIEEYEALVEAAKDAEDVRAVDKVREAIARGEEEMIPYREARREWADDTSKVKNGKRTDDRR